VRIPLAEKNDFTTLMEGLKYNVVELLMYDAIDVEKSTRVSLLINDHPLPDCEVLYATIFIHETFVNVLLGGQCTFSIYFLKFEQSIFVRVIFFPLSLPLNEVAYPIIPVAQGTLNPPFLPQSCPFGETVACLLPACCPKMGQLTGNNVQRVSV
jgi:hypothetical protein